MRDDSYQLWILQIYMVIRVGVEAVILEIKNFDEEVKWKLAPCHDTC